MSQNVLRLDNITMQFGGVVAVDNLSLEVNEGEIVALIGPNGAGKTTAFNTITGVYEPTNGQVSFMGEPIVRNHPQGKMKQNYKGKEAGKFVQMPVLDPTPDRITKLGMARTFQYSSPSICCAPATSFPPRSVSTARRRRSIARRSWSFCASWVWRM